MATSTITSSIQAQVRRIGQHQYEAASSNAPPQHLFASAPPVPGGGEPGDEGSNNRSGEPIGPPMGPPGGGGQQADVGAQGHAPHPTDKFIGREPQIFEGDHAKA